MLPRFWWLCAFWRHWLLTLNHLKTLVTKGTLSCKSKKVEMSTRQRLLNPTAAPFVPLPLPALPPTYAVFTAWASWSDPPYDEQTQRYENVFQADYGTFPLDYDTGAVQPQPLQFDQLMLAQCGPDYWTPLLSEPQVDKVDETERVLNNLRISRERNLHHPQPERQLHHTFLEANV